MCTIRSDKCSTKSVMTTADKPVKLTCALDHTLSRGLSRKTASFEKMSSDFTMWIASRKDLRKLF